MRKEKNAIRYFGFGELADAYGIKVSKRTSDEKKLASQREKFCKRHKCRACGQPMTWITGDIMTCCNDACKGIKVTSQNDDGTEKVHYVVSYDLLDNKGAEIAQNIFE